MTVGGGSFGPSTFVAGGLPRLREKLVAAGRTIYIYSRGRRDITRDSGSGVLPRERVDSEGRTPEPGQDGCLDPEGTRAHAGRYITFGRSGDPHRGRGRDKGG